MKAQVRGQRLADIRERVAQRNDAPGKTATNTKHRHVFARVVRAAKCRVVAVISRDDQEIISSQPREDRRHAAIERLQRRCVAGDVAAMTEVGVEVDEICEAKPAVRQRGLRRKQRIDDRIIVVTLDDGASRAMTKDVGDLSE